MTNTNKTIISIIAVIVLIIGGKYALSHKGAAASPTTNTTTTANAANSNETIATVNGENIPRTKLVTAEAQFTSQGVQATTTEAQAALQKSALDSVIARTLLKQAAASAGITASSTQVETELSRAKSQFKTAEAYQQALTTQGVTEDQLKTQISEDLVIQAYLTQKLNMTGLTASEAEIQAAYKKAAAGQTGVPLLKDVHEQVKQLVIQQKQQVLINAEVNRLRAAADIKILI